MNIKEIAKKFKENNYELWEVGGSVRDKLLKRESNDIDLATNALPDVTERLLSEFGSVYAIGKEYGTIGLYTDGKKVEVTTYRKEIYPNNSRKPDVTFGNNLVEDLIRRDFTINSLSVNPLSNIIIDLFGGVNDIKNKIIRCIREDDVTFNDDPLRAMRAVRFACQLNFGLNIKINYPERLSIVSQERIRDELSKILLSDRACWGVRKLCDFGLMEYIIPEFIALKNIEQGNFHTKDTFNHSLDVLLKGIKVDYKENNLIFRLACLLHDLGKPETKTETELGVHFYSHHHIGAKKATKILLRLKYDNNTIKRVSNLIEYHMSPIMLSKENLTKRIIRRLIRRVGEDNISMLLSLVRCDIRSSTNPRYKFMNVLTKMVEKCMEEHPETLDSPINGVEIMALAGLKPGREVGRVKNILTEMVLNGKLDKDDRDGAIIALREIVKT